MRWGKLGKPAVAGATQASRHVAAPLRHFGLLRYLAPTADMADNQLSKSSTGVPIRNARIQAVALRLPITAQRLVLFFTVNNTPTVSTRLVVFALK
jgi:hypothetical protein